MRKVLRRGVWFLIPLALALSSCGSGQGTDGMPVLTGVKAQRWIAASAEKAADVGTARVRGKVSLAAAGESFSIGMDGAVDFRTGAAELRMDTADLGLPEGKGGTIEMRVVDGVAYMRFDGFPGGAGDELAEQAAGKWIRIDPTTVGGPEISTGFESSDPRATLDALRGVTDVERLGTEDIDGVTTTHYRGHIDVAKALSEVPADQRAQLEKLMAGSGDWPVDVWVDAEGRTRKIAMKVDSPLLSVGVEVEYLDYGADVDLRAPAPEDVVDLQPKLAAGQPAV